MNWRERPHAGAGRARSTAAGLALLAVLVLVCPSLPTSAGRADGGRPWPRLCPESDRFGVAVPGAGQIGNYDVGQLHAGWYHSFSISGAPLLPSGMGYVQTVRLVDQVCSSPPCDSACGDCAYGWCPCPTWQQLADVAAANPGSLWLIGNEPDRPAYQDDVHPEVYARLYHELYGFLKERDPSCKVGIGGVVQPTPVRLTYLDMILDAYRSDYRHTMPVDVWNTHNYVLREKRPYPGCGDCWGADIPPGVPVDVGILYEIDDHDNMAYWSQHLIDLRTWMRDRGYRDRPLVVSEFGILMPMDYGDPPFDTARTRAFMLASFDWMMNATDPAIGYEADGNRLVQAWAWYSLDDDALWGEPVASNLFDPDTAQITPLGEAFSAYTSGLVSPGIDLAPLEIRHSWPEPGGGGQVTITITASVSNLGRDAAGEVAVAFERDGTPSGTAVIPHLGPGELATVSQTWSDLTLGQRLEVTARADPEGLLQECSAANNSLSTWILVTDRRLLLPIAGSGW